MPFNLNYPYGGNLFGQPNYGQPQPQMFMQNFAQPQQQPTQPPRPKTNKIFVTSLDDAMSRIADYDSQMIYLDQDKPLLYEIYTDGQGRKTPTIIQLSPSDGTGSPKTAKNDKVEYVTRQEFDDIQAQMAAFNDRLESMTKKGAKKNEQPIE